MTILMIVLFNINPFYDSNFRSLPMRSASLFSNPAGLGFFPGSELLSTYEFDRDNPNTFMWGATLKNIAFGWSMVDTFNYYEAAVGYDIPGAFSLGYAYQFGDRKDHILGILGHPTEQLSLGYRTTVGEYFHMFGGLSIRPLKNYLTLSADVEYEGIDSVLTYYYGAMLQPITGIKVYAHSNEDFSNWHAGLNVSLGQIVVAGAYTHEGHKISAGIILSAMSYPTFMPARARIATLRLDQEFPELERKTFLGFPISIKPGYTKLLNDLDALKKRSHVHTILVQIGDHGLTSSQMEELKQSFNSLKESGKKIVFFADTYRNTLTYELACAGDLIILSPLGEVHIPGIAMRKVFVKNTFDKLGIDTDISRIGEYKSAAEILSRSDMSEEDRQQLSEIVDHVYTSVLSGIASARQKTPGEVEDLISAIADFNSDDALAYGLVDTLLYDFELEDFLKTRYGTDAVADVRAITEEKTVGYPWQRLPPKIALVIAEGSIVPGKGEANFFVSSLIGGDTYATIFEEIKDDPSIKAVVFRINSGGGDAFASEKIAYAVQRCAEKKPVIVSMGEVAGSGGYYIACLADEIFANERTITGSIGVLGINLVTKGLYDKIGVSWDHVKRGPHSDAAWGLRHLSEDEMEKMDREIAWYYDKFTSRVAQGRNMTQTRVDTLGRGRIYSGAHAQNKGLIDHTGGFINALNAAKKAAGLADDVRLVVYPGKLGFTFLNDATRESRYLYIMPECVLE